MLPLEMLENATGGKDYCGRDGGAEDRFAAVKGDRPVEVRGLDYA
jgi:hypothetical protein